MAPEMVRQRAVIVIPTLNEADRIVSVMDRLLADAPVGTKLVVTDGGSTDGTRDLVRQYAKTNDAVTLIANADRIQSAGINLAVLTAAAATDADVLIRADAHAVYPPDYCRILLEECVASGAASVTVAMHTLAQGGFSTGVAAAQNSFLGTGGSAHRTGGGVGRFVDHGHHAAMSLAAFRDVGGYDAAQSHNEDAELDHRLRKAGHRIWLTGRTSLGYFPRRTPVALFKQYFAYGKGRATTVAKHAMRMRARQMAPLAVAPAVLVAITGLFAAIWSPWWLLLAMPAAVWAVLCLLGGVILAVRAGEWPVVWAGPAAMLMHLGWSLGFLAQVLRFASRLARTSRPGQPQNVGQRE